MHGVARSQAASVAEAIPEVLRNTEGAFSMLFLTPTDLIAIRDARGFRPLALGRLDDAWVIASETCAFDLIDAKYVRDIEPGEMVVINEEGLRSSHPLAPQKHSMCIFEHVYFSRPDSLTFGHSVNRSRHKMGQRLAIEQPVDADLVVPVPDSGVPAAIGYSSESGLPFRFGLVRNHYIGRTFIEPTDSLRKQGVALKFNALAENLRGKRVIMIDDSIVRGNTAGPLVKLLRDAGAREVHVRITCPPIAHPCYMGVDMGTYDNLIAHHMTLEEMRDHIDCDTLHFLSLEGMMRAVGRAEGYCNACFTGLYPLEIDYGQTKTGFEKAIA
jgi:amidophosphoribosyltransferase